jgi:hypothetical protein
LLVPPLRSSELWDDTQVTGRVSSVRPLDLVLVNATVTPSAPTSMFVPVSSGFCTSARRSDARWCGVWASSPGGRGTGNHVQG